MLYRFTFDYYLQGDLPVWMTKHIWSALLDLPDTVTPDIAEEYITGMLPSYMPQGHDHKLLTFSLV